MSEKIDVGRVGWDRLFAPSSALAVITTVNADGQPNAAAFGTCTRVCHDPVHIAFTVGTGKDTSNNVLATGQFTVNLPSDDPEQLRKTVITGDMLPASVNEIEAAGLTALSAVAVRPPRIADFGRHFECEVVWTRQWETRLMVVGAVLAASCDPRVIDADGRVNWAVARPAHFCGSGYVDADSHSFVSAWQVTTAPNSGPPALSTLEAQRAAGA